MPHENERLDEERGKDAEHGTLDAGLDLDDEEELDEEGEFADPTVPADSRFREAGAAAATGDIFQRVIELLPADPHLFSIPAGTSALEGLRELGARGYSQGPVMRGDLCIGVFSYRSFSRAVAAFPAGRGNISEIPVEDCLERLQYVRLDDNVEDIFDRLDRDDAVLAGDSGRPIAIVTPMDALYYLYGLANGYVLMRQIELALRYTVRLSMDQTTLKNCIDATIRQKYVAQRRKVPERLEDMDFSDLWSLINSGKTWPHFTRVLGGNHDLVKTRLAPLGAVRNELFHFRRPIRVDEYEMLAFTRNWLLLKIELSETPA